MGEIVRFTDHQLREQRLAIHLFDDLNEAIRKALDELPSFKSQTLRADVQGTWEALPFEAYSTMLTDHLEETSPEVVEAIVRLGNEIRAVTNPEVEVQEDALFVSLTVVVEGEADEQPPLTGSAGFPIPAVGDRFGYERLEGEGWQEFLVTERQFNYGPTSVNVIVTARRLTDS